MEMTVLIFKPQNHDGDDCDNGNSDTDDVVVTLFSESLWKRKKCGGIVRRGVPCAAFPSVCPYVVAHLSPCHSCVVVCQSAVYCALNQEYTKFGSRQIVYY